MKTSLDRGVQYAGLIKELTLSNLRSSSKTASQTKARRRLADRLGLMHGLPQKIGQLLAFSDINNSSEDYLPLTEGDPSMSLDEIHHLFILRTGYSVEEVFSDFSQTGISASIGQVHHARLKDGREVAVKIQYPEISQNLELDLRALGWITEPVGDLRKGFDIKAYRSEIGTRLQEELNYKQEAKYLQYFSDCCHDWYEVVTPEVMHEFCSEKILITTWLAGESVQAAMTWSLEQRRKTAQLILEFFLRGLFEWEVIHGDPHPGNYRFIKEDENVSLGVLDFGCCKPLKHEFVSALLNLINQKLQRQCDDETCWQCYMQMGFDENLMFPLKEHLADLTEVLFEPFISKGVYAMNQWNLRSRIANLLGKNRMAFRLAAPAEMIFIVRAFQGVIHYLSLLDAPVNWNELFLKISNKVTCVNGFECRKVIEEIKVYTESEFLRVCVEEDNEVSVDLKFKAKVVDNLQDIIPIDLKQKLESREISLDVLAKKAQVSGYQRGELFCLTEEKKKVRVWLE
ncbi:MAG: AarF/ABC1/UbiB kinase family protein [Verrucomicrobiota bacterium]